MRTFIGMAVLAVLLIGPAMVLAQQPVSRTEEVSAAFTIEAIDHSTRVVTLRNKAGLLEEVYCGPEVQRFEALKVGDTVTFRYFETVVTALSKPGARGAAVDDGHPHSGRTGRHHRPPDHRHRHASRRSIRRRPAVTIRTAAGGRSVFKVQDVKNLEGYKAGDQVTMTYTRGLAVSVTPPEAARAEAEHGHLRLRDARHRLRLQADRPDWFDTCGHQAALVRGRVRRGRQHLRRRAPDAASACRSIVADRAGRAARRTFEFELFGTGVDAGQTTFRLRHAYGELGQFGAGPDWSPFMDIDVFPNSIEYWGPTGMVFFRNVQVRWMPIQGDTQLTLALERPGASGDAGRSRDRIELEDVDGALPAARLLGRVPAGRATGATSQLAGIAAQDQLGRPARRPVRPERERDRLGHQPQLEPQARRRRHACGCSWSTARASRTT